MSERPSQIITVLREAEVGLTNGETVGMVRQELEISEQTHYRWCQEFGGMNVDRAWRSKDLEQENAQLKRAVVNPTEVWLEKRVDVGVVLPK